MTKRAEAKYNRPPMGRIFSHPKAPSTGANMGRAAYTAQGKLSDFGTQLKAKQKLWLLWQYFEKQLQYYAEAIHEGR